MNAATIAAAFGDAIREGGAWRCRCPLHGGRSLVVRDGDGGRALATCWGGCRRLDVLAEVRRRGLLSEGENYAPRTISPTRRDDDGRRTARAFDILRNTKRGPGTIVAQYLASREIVPDQWPRSLRFHPHCPRPKDDRNNFVSPLPAMVALVEHAELGAVAIHATYLQPDGGGKAEIKKPKAIFGPVAGGAVQLGIPRAGEWLVIAEGIETALSVMVACSMPAWAALSACGIRKLVLPHDATHVIIAADHDASGTGQRAAGDAAQRWLAEGCRVRIAMPSGRDTDMADVLLAGAASEARHVA